MRYFGSKASILPALEQLILARVSSGNFCDPFGGIGTIGAAFKRYGFEVHTGDLLAFPVAFQIARVMLNDIPLPSEQLRLNLHLTPTAGFCDALATLPPVRSWVYREFCTLRPFFTPVNAAKIDAFRRGIARWHRNGLIDTPTCLYLRACLIDAADRVANTAGTYYAYLKHYTRKALLPLAFRLIPPTPGLATCTASHGEALDLVAAAHYNVLYLDPPYNRRDYAAYYHFPETLATGRRARPYGVSGVDMAARPRSLFASPSTAEGALENLLASARYDLLVLHYSDAGNISSDRIRSMLAAHGKCDEYTISALGYGTSHRRFSLHHVYLLEQ